MLSPAIQKENLSHPQEELEGLLSAQLASAETLEEKRARLNEFKDSEMKEAPSSV